ncbi:hypothetical protein [Magnetospirillum molischianum]|nr:hypothetical protein [Magnetospirillum molischianum]
MLTNPYCRKLAQLVVNDLYDCIGEIGEGQIQAVGILKPDLFLRFRQLVIIQAAFHSNSLALIWEHSYGVVVKPYALNEELWDSQKAKGCLIRIWYLLSPEDNSSKVNLHRNWQSGEKDQHINPEQGSFDRVIDCVAREVANFFKGEPYIWNANNVIAHGVGKRACAEAWNMGQPMNEVSDPLPPE